MAAKTRKNGAVEILIVEDSPTQAEQLRHLLEERDYAVTVAADGRQGLEAARRRKPALIISDILMPELDGYGLCKAVKSDEKLKDVPVILVTTLSDPQDVIRGLESGADNFIRKPYDENYLLSRVDYLLMNLELRKTQKIQLGAEISLGGRKHFITAERQQILDLLISTYEQAVYINQELKTREKELARSNEVLNALNHIADGLNWATSERDVAETALGRALQLPGVQAGWMFLREGESGLRLAAARNLPPALDAPGTWEGDCLCRRRLDAGEFDSIINVIECEPLGRAKGDTRGLRCHASIPLWSGGRTLGVMNLAGPGQGSLKEDELKVLHAVGNEIAVALERARLLEHLEQLVEERTAALRAEIAERKRAEGKVAALNRIYAVLSAINSTIVRVRDRQELFDETCRIAVEHGKFGLAWVGKFDPATLDVTPIAHQGTGAGEFANTKTTARADVPSGHGVVGRAVRSREVAFVNDLTAERREATRRGYRSLVALPLLVEGAVFGTLTLYAKEANFFDEDELKLLRELAGDISFALDHIEKEERLNYLAYYDSLTGLPNHSLFHDRLAQLLEPERHNNVRVAVLALDLERFKSINDAFGRHTGDALLRLVADRLSEAVGTRDRLARISADRFAAILADARDEAEIAHVVEDRVITSLSRPFTVGGNELMVSVKVGIALFPGDGQDADTLFTNAEAALRKAKSSGEHSLFYAPQMNARVSEKLTLEYKLRRALEKQEFVLYYQPKVELRGRRVTGFEALIRWNDPETGVVPPLDFIPLLEETGLILEVGRWALERALSDFDQWRSQGLAPPRIAVNVSAAQLRQKEFFQMVKKALEAHGSVAGSLDLEITESVVMEDIEANIERLRALREMKVGIAVDDFGTGYSSLSYIAKLPIDALKVDRAFIMKVTTNPDDALIVSSMISLAHALNLRVIAEGVETEEQAKFLGLLKCDEMQGYVVSHPVPPDRIEVILRKPAG
ncbi:MAG: EAL domain-containing protein [Betaproteobacteria bacterium]|nr:EAL domain-containing protein [Betaproteobacteria bacterium]